MTKRFSSGPGRNRFSIGQLRFYRGIFRDGIGIYPAGLSQMAERYGITIAEVKTKSSAIGNGVTLTRPWVIAGPDFFRAEPHLHMAGNIPFHPTIIDPSIDINAAALCRPTGTDGT